MSLILQDNMLWRSAGVLLFVVFVAWVAALSAGEGDDE